MADEVKRVAWSTSIHGDKHSGFVRVHVFRDEDTGMTTTEVEYCAALGLPWRSVPPVA